MAGPIVGSIEHYHGTGLTTGSVQSFFVNCYNFFNNNSASLGIQKIAYNTGSQGTGMEKFRGMNYYDQPLPCGDNAWAVFRFMSASIPFDVLIQYTSTTLCNSAPGNPCLYNGYNSTYCFLVATAHSSSGEQMWNGTTNNNGNDKKSTLVWKNTAGAFYVPRSNDSIRTGGTSTSKQNMFGVNIATNVAYRQHIVADYDSFVILFDSAADNSYELITYGKYTPLLNLTASIPYFGLADSIPLTEGAVYGVVAGGAKQGGIAFPNVLVSGSCSMTIDNLGTYLFKSVDSQPSKIWGPAKYDEFPLFVGAYELPNQAGLCGQHFDLIRSVYNIATHDTNADGTRAVFGNTTLASTKITIPFHSGTTPGTGITKTGVQFSIP